MKIEEFEQKLPTLYETPFTSDHPIDRRLQPVFESMEGMATENKLALLNLAVSLMDEGEAYFEVGTWKGMSLCGAMFENTQFRCFACYNFAEFGGPKDELFANIEKIGRNRMKVYSFWFGKKMTQWIYFDTDIDFPELTENGLFFKKQLD